MASSRSAPILARAQHPGLHAPVGGDRLGAALQHQPGGSARTEVAHHSDAGVQGGFDAQHRRPGIAGRAGHEAEHAAGVLVVIRCGDGDPLRARHPARTSCPAGALMPSTLGLASEHQHPRPGHRLRLRRGDLPLADRRRPSVRSSPLHTGCRRRRPVLAGILGAPRRSRPRHHDDRRLLGSGRRATSARRGRLRRCAELWVRDFRSWISVEPGTVDSARRAACRGHANGDCCRMPVSISAIRSVELPTAGTSSGYS